MVNYLQHGVKHSFKVKPWFLIFRFGLMDEFAFMNAILFL